MSLFSYRVLLILPVQVFPLAPHVTRLVPALTRPGPLQSIPSPADSLHLVTAPSPMHPCRQNDFANPNCIVPLL